MWRKGLLTIISFLLFERTVRVSRRADSAGRVAGLFPPACSRRPGGPHNRFILRPCPGLQGKSPAGRLLLPGSKVKTRFVSLLEEAFATYCTSDHAVACDSGTSAFAS